MIGANLVPTCGALWGVAAGAHTRQNRIEALYEFERRTARRQVIYHAYHRGTELFPTAEELSITKDPQQRRILFLNWKPRESWGQIAAGDRGTEAYLDRLATHIKGSLTEPFFFTMNHEPENDVVNRPGSGMTATDYAGAFRHVVLGLRQRGVTNLVSVMCYMAFVPWNVKGWFEQLYPGADVVDWVAWDTYAYSEPGYGYGDFAEMMNRVSGSRKDWPGFYNWAATSFPDKPLMLGEWGVWHSSRNPQHQAKFFDSARLQLESFPRLKAMVYFESPSAEGRSSMIDDTPAGLASFQLFSQHPAFDVNTDPLGRRG
ncbi:endoglucanase [Catellatospora sp. NEAU-YM18]|nr:endoglucanase [Catellatospora tritici]